VVRSELGMIFPQWGTKELRASKNHMILSESWGSNHLRFGWYFETNTTVRIGKPTMLNLLLFLGGILSKSKLFPLECSVPDGALRSDDPSLYNPLDALAIYIYI
jgi:hypothetical protein